MNSKHVLILAVLGFSFLSPQLSTIFAQGSLTPTGAPGATMLTLSQIDPRTRISSAPYNITTPGAYYLTTNLTVTSANAISISTNGVTLDLNGFTISTTTSGSYGIFLPGSEGFGIGNTDITIANGHITSGVTNYNGTYSGTGFTGGISYNVTGGTPHNIRVTGVSVSGCGYYGIYLDTGNSTVVESCAVYTVGGYGIEASSVSHSTATGCGGTAIVADTASDCYGQCSGLGDGLDATVVNNCCGVTYSSSANTYGLIGMIANNCYGENDNNGYGLEAGAANGCYGVTYSSSTTSIALLANTANNCFSKNFGYGTGLAATTANNCVGYSFFSGPGLDITAIATGCYGNSASGVGIISGIANSCYSSSGDGGITNKYNMP
jgi:hypothetical protein